MARDVLSGDKALIRTIGAVQQDYRLRVDPIAMEALEPMREEVQILARFRRQPGNRPPGGHLDEGIVKRKISGGSGAVRVFWISLANRARLIGHLVEFGTAPHFQPRRNRMHPGARPFPFFTPGYESEKNNVVRKISELTWRALNAAAAKFGPK